MNREDPNGTYLSRNPRHPQGPAQGLAVDPPL